MSAPTGEERERDRDRDAERSAYDPELDFLVKLEREVTRRATAAYEMRARAERAKARRSAGKRDRDAVAAERRAARGGHGALRAGSRRGDGLRLTGGRVARRSLTLVALLCLIGASAFGAGRILDATRSSPADPHRSALVAVASGRSGSDRWSLGVYKRGGELCRVLVVADGEYSRCSLPPRSRGLAAASALSPTRRYVYGVSGQSVARVLVSAGEQAGAVATRAIGPSDGVLPRGTRWFVAVLTRPTGEPDPRALVRAVSAEDRPLGRPVSECAEATESLNCGD